MRLENKIKRRFLILITFSLSRVGCVDIIRVGVANTLHSPPPTLYTYVHVGLFSLSLSSLFL